MSPILFDVIIAAILLLFVTIGAYKGLILTLSKVVVLVLSLVGATLLASTLTPTVADWFTPAVERQLHTSVQAIIPADSADNLSQDAIDALLDNRQALLVLSLLGIDSQEAQQAITDVEDAAADWGNQVLHSVAVNVTRTVVNFVLWILLFIALLILLSLAMKALDLVASLPVLNVGNAIGGGAIGLAGGALLVWLMVAIALTCGVNLSTISAQSYLLRFFLTWNPLSLLGAFVV